MTCNDLLEEMGEPEMLNRFFDTLGAFPKLFPNIVASSGLKNVNWRDLEQFITRCRRPATFSGRKNIKQKVIHFSENYSNHSNLYDEGI